MWKGVVYIPGQQAPTRQFRVAGLNSLRVIVLPLSASKLPLQSASCTPVLPPRLCTVCVPPSYHCFRPSPPPLPPAQLLTASQPAAPGPRPAAHPTTASAHPRPHSPRPRCCPPPSSQPHLVLVRGIQQVVRVCVGRAARRTRLLVDGQQLVDAAKDVSRLFKRARIDALQRACSTPGLPAPRALVALIDDEVAHLVVVKKVIVSVIVTVVAAAALVGVPAIATVVIAPATAAAVAVAVAVTAAVTAVAAPAARPHVTVL
eukprot:289255-Chlamydomonas_euryale.AAC.12